MTTPLHATAKELAEKLYEADAFIDGFRPDIYEPLILAALQRVHDEASNLRLSSVAREQAARIAELEKERDQLQELRIKTYPISPEVAGFVLGALHGAKMNTASPSTPASVRNTLNEAEVMLRAAIDAARSAANQGGQR